MRPNYKLTPEFVINFIDSVDAAPCSQWILVRQIEANRILNWFLFISFGSFRVKNLLNLFNRIPTYDGHLTFFYPFTWLRRSFTILSISLIFFLVISWIFGCNILSAVLQFVSLLLRIAQFCAEEKLALCAFCEQTEGNNGIKIVRFEEYTTFDHSASNETEWNIQRNLFFTMKYDCITQPIPFNLFI